MSSFYNNIYKLKRGFNEKWENGEIFDAVNIGETIIFQYKSNFMDKDIKYADDIFDIAYANEEVGNFEKACKLYKESSSLIKQISGTDINYSYRINNLAVAYSRMEKHDLALKYYEECYKLRMLLLGENHRQTVESLYNAGNAYAAVQKNEKALRCLKRALKFREKKDDDYVDNLNSIGYVYEAMEDYDNAVKYLLEGLALTKKLEGLLSLEYLKNLCYIAGVFGRMGCHEKAINYYDMFMNISKKLLGEKHPYYIVGLNGVAEIYEMLDKTPKAIECRLSAMELVKDSVGANNVYYARLLTDTALLYKKQKEYDMAVRYFLEAVEIKKTVLGDENAEYIKDLILLSGIYFENKQYDKTMALLMEVLNIIENKNFLFDECIYELAKIYVLLDEFQRMDESAVSVSDYKEIDKILKNLRENISDSDEAGYTEG